MSNRIGICKSCLREKEIRYPALMLCRKCYQDKYNREYYRKHRERIKAQVAKYYYSNREKCLEYRKKYREKVYFNDMRQAVLQRDQYTCQYCQQKYPESMLTVHHKDRNGRGKQNPNNNIDNLLTLCRACHAREHYKELYRSRIAKDQSRWARKHEKCRECGTTSIKHGGKGLCKNCYARSRNKAHTQG